MVTWISVQKDIYLVRRSIERETVTRRRYARGEAKLESEYKTWISVLPLLLILIILPSLSSSSLSSFGLRLLTPFFTPVSLSFSLSLSRLPQSSRLLAHGLMGMSLTGDPGLPCGTCTWDMHEAVTKAKAWTEYHPCLERYQTRSPLGQKCPRTYCLRTFMS